MGLMMGVCSLTRSPLDGAWVDVLWGWLSAEPEWKKRDCAHVLSPGLSAVQSSSHRACSMARTRREEYEIVVMVCGRLHERRSILTDLEVADGSNDAELILAAYETWGDSFASRLHGEYAAVLWTAPANDADGERRCWIVRDYCQAVPVYYLRRGASLAFSTDLDALLEIPGADDAYDLTYMTTAVVLEDLNWNRTPFAAVKQVPGGSIVRLDSEGVKERIVQSMPEPGSLCCRRFTDYQEHLRSVLSECVRDRLEPHQTAAIALSSGIDSGSIAATASSLRRGELADRQVIALTISPREHPEADESEGAAAIANRLGLPHFVADPLPFPGDIRSRGAGPVTPRPSLAALLRSYWLPFRDQTASLGAGVVMTGTGGNELFSVNADYLSYLLRAGRYPLFCREAVRWMRQGKSIGRIALETLHFHKRNKGAQFAADLGPLHPWIKDQDSFHKDFASNRFDHPLLAERHANLLEVGQPHEAMQALLSSAGIRLSDPFWDVRMLRFAYSLPLEINIPQPGIHKPLLRQAFEQDIPLGLQGATGFLNVYLHSQLYRMWEVMMEIIERRGDVLESIFDMDRLKVNATRLRMDSSDYGPFLLTYVIACWIDDAEARKETRRRRAETREKESVLIGGRTFESSRE